MARLLNAKKYVIILSGNLAIKLPKTDEFHVVNLRGQIIPISALRQ